jgi:hypothetical protein
LGCVHDLTTTKARTREHKIAAETTCCHRPAAAWISSMVLVRVFRSGTMCLTWRLAEVGQALEPATRVNPTPHRATTPVGNYHSVERWNSDHGQWEVWLHVVVYGMFHRTWQTLHIVLSLLKKSNTRLMTRNLLRLCISQAVESIYRSSCSTWCGYDMYRRRWVTLSNTTWEGPLGALAFVQSSCSNFYAYSMLSVCCTID